MNTFVQSKFLADMLCKRSVFRSTSIDSIHFGKDYRLFLNVPAHCLTVMDAADGSTPDVSDVILDLLICRGKEALYAISFSADDRKIQELFSGQLSALPHFFLSSDEMNEEVALDICGEIEFRLRCDKSDPLHTNCFLYMLSISQAVSRMNEPAVCERFRKGALSFLQKKHLVDSSGDVTGYGHACGLFQRCSAKRPPAYVTAPSCISAIHRAMGWHDRTAETPSLQYRLDRIKQGLPVESMHMHTQTLRNLLDTQLEVLYERYPQDLPHLRTLLSQAQRLSFGAKVSAFGDREDIATYGDVLYAVRNLWEYTAHRDVRNKEAAEICEKILTFLSFPLWSEPEVSAADALQHTGGDTLQERLRRILPEIYHTPLALMPLQLYFYAAACVTESDYPLWLYRTTVKPLLTYHCRENPLCIHALHAIYLLSQDEEVSGDCEDYFPLLYNVLVEPFGGIL